MLGIIAWIRPDGRKALVVVAGSDQMASGDPGSQIEESLKVGDLVYMPGISPDKCDFSPGLTLVHSEFWPQIVQDIGAMSRAPSKSKAGSNVIDLCAARAKVVAAATDFQPLKIAAE